MPNGRIQTACIVVGLRFLVRNDDDDLLESRLFRSVAMAVAVAPVESAATLNEVNDSFTIVALSTTKTLKEAARE